MATMHRIHEIKKTDRFNPCERIEVIAGFNSDGSRWSLSQKAAIEGIEGGRWSFYVERPTGHRVNVIVSKSRFNNKYIKTEADGENPDNLLSLPEIR